MLQLENLEVAYGHVQAVCGLTLSVAAGTIVGLVGANGAGKTSTLNAISGLVPRAGQVKFEGEELRGSTADTVRRGLVQVAQGRQLFSEMTVAENLELGGFLSRPADLRDRLDQVIQQFPLLKERLKQRAGTLSGGQQQVLAIARALMASPKLLLIDEPCLGLSPKMVRVLSDLVRQLNSEGLTMLLVEQNTAFVFGLASHVFVIENGRAVLQGSPDELRHNDMVRSAYLGI
jgi:branched-chain amino acid transport system ATP-binding protein